MLMERAGVHLRHFHYVVLLGWLILLIPPLVLELPESLLVQDAS